MSDGEITVFSLSDTNIRKAGAKTKKAPQTVELFRIR
jgi:hypothetical protein